MVKFAYNNAKNVSTNYTPFKLYNDYYSCILFKDDTNPCLKSRSGNKLAKELKKLMLLCQHILLHA